MILIKAFFSLLLIIIIIDPETVWSICEGRNYKNIQPSMASIKIFRVIAVTLLILVWFAFHNR